MIKFETQLYDHQRAAVEKLSRVKVGALYMEQGTGKTRTALELIKLRYDAGKIDRAIWLCPCSVKQNLRNDIIYHCGEMPDNIIICGIETLSTSIKWISKLMNIAGESTCLIVDESTLVKNHRALRTQHITQMAEKCKYKLILNGTPITKLEADLYAQWYMLDPRILGYQSFYSFAANHIEYDRDIPDKIVRCLNTEYLTRKISPFTYQVLKKDCLKLPRKDYSVRRYPMTEEQDTNYYDVFNGLMNEVDEMQPHTIYKLFNYLQHVISGKHVEFKKSGIFMYDRFNDARDNPRVKTLLNIISELSDQKVIIFCKYTSEITDICNILGDKTVRFDGSISLKKRVENIEKFKGDAQYFVANKVCAGYGLNLQFCHNVIFYSNDWSFATRSQAEDRVHRIGQENEVHIYDICAEYTLDARILDCLSNKENLVNRFKKDIEKIKNKQDLKRWINLKEGSSDAKQNL